MLSALRIILCLFPQNKWLSAAAPLSWGIYRNIPFALLGLLIIILFYKSARKNHDAEFKNMWLTIVLSFGFYIPVVLFADQIPMIGMLMIPKTCAYVWTVLIGYKAIVLSFGFYIPVVLFADQIPMIGMLMIPKTCAYVWTVLIGYKAMKNHKE